MRSTKFDQANVERALHSGVWGQNEGKFEGIDNILISVDLD